MGIPNPTKQAAASAAANLGNYVTLFTAAAGTTGANEAAVTRKPTTWTHNTNGTVSGSQVNVPCPAGSYPEAGLFSALTAGNFCGSSAFSAGTISVVGTGASVDVTPNWASP